MELIIGLVVFFIIQAVKKAKQDEAKQAKEQQRQSQPVYQMPKKATRVESPKVQVQRTRPETRPEAPTKTIVERAKANANENLADVTLETMEAEHNPSERVAAAVHYHPEDVLPESMLGSVEDLMVKGFDGNLCFERDFVGEGLDMISRFSYQ